MPYYDRFDICEAYYLAEYLYNVSGILQERASNRRRKMSIGYQLYRMNFRISPLFMNYVSLTENGQAIYDELIARLRLDKE